MRNKIIMIAAMLAVMVAMTGIAAADPGIITSPLAIPIDVSGVGIANVPISVVEKQLDSNGNPITINSITIEIWRDVAGNDELNLPEDYLSNDLNVGWGTQGLIKTDTRTYNVPADGSWNSVTPTTFLGVPAWKYDIDLNLQNDAGLGPEKYYLKICANSGTGTGCGNARAIQNSEGSFIPEFPTVALPIAAVIGLVFLFQQKKKKEE